MGQCAEIVSCFYQLVFKMLPEMRRQAEIIHEKQKLCVLKRHIVNNQSDPADLGNRSIGNSADPCDQFPPLIPFTTGIICCCLFSMFPGADSNAALSFILSLYALRELLENCRAKKDITEETDIRDLYGCLSCAVDPSRGSFCAMPYSIKNLPDLVMKPALQTCLSDQCRLQSAVLPSYRIVAPKIKKYMQFYIDLQSYRNFPANISIDCLKTWSSNYLNRYNEISVWEFCAASDSFLGMAAMYSAATKPDLTGEETALLDEACFPWLCGIDSLLHAAIHARISDDTRNLNFASFYKNLKECEERIVFFAKKAEAACKKLKNSSLYSHLVKTMSGLYLTDPEADFGMLGIAAGNILKKSSARAYRNACRLIRLLHIV